jgi:hypothetical protein
MAEWFTNLRRKGLAARATALTGVLLVFGVVGFVIAYLVRGWALVGMAAAAWGVCWFSSLLALGLSDCLRGPKLALHGMLAAMAARTGLPLGFLLALRFWGGGLSANGIIYYLACFYLMALAVEVPLSLPPVATCDRGTPVPEDRAS